MNICNEEVRILAFSKFCPEIGRQTLAEEYLKSALEFDPFSCRAKNSTRFHGSDSLPGGLGLAHRDISYGVWKV